jgi:hypothetical protein
LDALKVGRVAGNQLEPVFEGDGSDHRVGQTDRLADSVQRGPDLSGEFCSVSEGKNLHCEK